ncbi:hypothetical protein HK103_005489 [Boothiomyces macroporosus]|uniref:CBM1 domain-containing protein n=1 Tax=Boothiomyces macroporosus TaxID=261099 RepID=A0AAD5Y3C3_9FUNG|nr:hypothetical protein HK103_005489 [Boothiomyces macroporosus]
MLNLLLLVSNTFAADTNFAVNAYWFTDPVNAPFVYFESTIVVPNLLTSPWDTTFIWPGLQPLGRSCAPNPSNTPLSLNSWWISAQYVNTFVTPIICTGGDVMNVNVGDTLKMVMSLRTGTTVWDQTVTNMSNGKSVSFSYDLQGQEQGWAEFVLETPAGWHANPPQFVVSNIVMRSAPGTTVQCDYQSSAYSGYPGASVTCDNPVKSGNTCTVSKCLYNGATVTSTTTSTTPSSTPTTGCTSPVAEWGQCSGTGYTGSTCCAAGLTCVSTSAWWGSCQKVQAASSTVTTSTTTSLTSSLTVVPSTTTSTTSSLSSPSSTCSSPVAEWGQCSGIGYTGSTCCASGLTCK